MARLDPHGQIFGHVFDALIHPTAGRPQFGVFHTAARGMVCLVYLAHHR